ncbi:MAG: hypothetical protein AAFV86_20245 [Pseudomonadota bacterium]
MPKDENTVRREATGINDDQDPLEPGRTGEPADLEPTVELGVTERAMLMAGE